MFFPITMFQNITKELSSKVLNAIPSKTVADLYDGPKNILLNEVNEFIENDSRTNLETRLKYKLNAHQKEIVKERKKFLQTNLGKDFKILLDRAEKLNIKNWQQAEFSEKVIYFIKLKLSSKLTNNEDYKNSYHFFLYVMERLLDIQRHFSFEKLFDSLENNLIDEEIFVLHLIATTTYELSDLSDKNYNYYSEYNKDSKEIVQKNTLKYIKFFLSAIYIDLHFNKDYLTILNTYQITSLAKKMIEDRNWPYLHPHGIFWDMTIDDLAMTIFTITYYKKNHNSANLPNYRPNHHFASAKKINDRLNEMIEKAFFTENDLKFLKPLAYYNFAILNQSGSTFYEVCENAMINSNAEFQSLVDLYKNYVKSYGSENWLCPLTKKLVKENCNDETIKEIIFEQIASLLNQYPYFKIGSIEYAQACTLNIIDIWQGRVTNVTDELIVVTNRFNDMLKNYLENSNLYPINPFYFFASTLATNNNIFFEINDEHHSFDSQILCEIDKRLIQLEPTTRKNLLNDISNADLSFASFISNEMDLSEFHIPHPISEIMNQYVQFKNRSILYKSNNATEQFKSVINYGKTVLLAKEKLPKIHIVNILFNALKSCGLSEKEIFKKRKINIVKNKFRSRINEVHTISPIEEIFIKSYEFYDSNKLITIKDKTYKIIDLISKEIFQYIQNLASNEIIVARAREKMYVEKVSETPELLTNYIDQIILNYLIKSADKDNNFDKDKVNSNILLAFAKQYTVVTPAVNLVLNIFSLFIKKQWSELIQILPVVGPSYTIVDGISHANVLETMEGTIALCIDIMFASFNEETLNLNSRLLEIEKSDQIEKELEQPIISNFVDENEPSSLIDQVLLGNNNVVWKTPSGDNVGVKYIEDLNEVLPLKLHSEVNQRYVVLDWETGGQNFNYHYIDKIRIPNQINDKFYSRKFTGLNGGGKYRDVLKYNVRGTPLQKRSALTQLAHCLPEMTEFSVGKQENAKVHLKTFFKKIVQDKNEQSLFNELDEGLMQIYDVSPTFRHFFNAHVYHPESTKIYKILFNDVHPATDFKNNIINLPLPEKLQNYKYVTSAEDKGIVLVEPTLQQIYLHEILHAITNFQDLIQKNAFSDRGPVIALESRIYFETGANVPERIVYRPDKTSISEKINVKEESIIAAWYENYFIDNYIDSTTKYIPENKNFSNLYGVAVNNRISIINYEKFIEKIEKTNHVETKATGLKNKKFFSKFFQLETDAKDNLFLFEASKSVYRQLKNTYTKSKTFRKAFDTWLYSKNNYHALADNTQWKLIIDKGKDNGLVDQIYGLDKAKSSINFYNGKIYYLSEKGLVENSLIRQIIEIFSEIIFHDLKINDLSNVIGERKSYQIFAEKILQELGKLSLRRITGENFIDNTASRWIYKPLSKLTRIMQTEDKYLNARYKILASKRKIKLSKTINKRHNSNKFGFFRFLNLNENLLYLKNINASSYDEFYKSNH